jgi:hypothetical protein
MMAIVHGYNDVYEPDPTLGVTPGSYGYPAPDADPPCETLPLIDAPGTSCVGNRIRLDASSSSIVGCLRMEYRWLAAGVPIPGCDVFSPAATCDVTFDGTTLYQLEIRCAAGVTCAATTGQVIFDEPAPPVVAGPEPAEVCAGSPIALDASTGYTRYEWTSVPPDPGVTPFTSSLNTIIATPDVPTDYTVTAYDVRGCPAVDTITVTTLPDPLPPPVGASLRVTKQAQDVHFTWMDLVGPAVGGYEVVGLECQGRDFWHQCAGRVPDPVTIQAAPPVGAYVAEGVQAMVHPNALALGDLIFYNVRALSPCAHRPGPTCNGWPRQIPPCP